MFFHWIILKFIRYFAKNELEISKEIICIFNIFWIIVLTTGLGKTTLAYFLFEKNKSSLGEIVYIFTPIFVIIIILNWKCIHMTLIHVKG
jgi:hypothetical protein